MNSVKSGDFFINMLQVNINGMPCSIIGAVIGSEDNKEESKQACLMATSNIINELKKDSPNLSLNYLQVTNTQNKVYERFSTLKEEMEDISMYQLYYKYSSDDIAEKVNAKLNALNNIIVQTFPEEEKTIDCVKFVGENQCNSIL